MANACKMVIDTGYNLLNRDIVHGDQILDIINKRETEGTKLGSTYFFDLQGEIQPATVRTITIPNSTCGKTSFDACECPTDEDTELKIDKRISCSKDHSKCASDLMGLDATKQIARRRNEIEIAMKKGYTKYVYEELKANGTSVTAPLTTYVEVADFLDNIIEIWDEADYLRKWNPTASTLQTGSVNARYVFLDSKVFKTLRRGLGDKCCLSLEAMQGELDAMDYDGVRIISVVGLRVDYGMDAMAVYAPFALMVSKCEIPVRVIFDFLETNAQGGTDMMDKFIGGENFGFKLAAQAAVQYIEATTKVKTVE